MDKVTWFEIPADDVSRASTFYNSVFGWNTSDMGGGSLMAITTPSDEQGVPNEPGAINGDISPRSEGFDKPMLVIETKDLDARVKSTVEAGGRVIVPRKELEGMNAVWAIVCDTEGNNIGILQDL
jgi:predicted enzyme related to lactoylglutathione lyase